MDAQVKNVQEEKLKTLENSQRLDGHLEVKMSKNDGFATKMMK